MDDSAKGELVSIWLICELSRLRKGPGADWLSSGPNWIHGTNNNPVLDLAKETNTVTMNWDGRQSVVDALGKYLSDKEAAENTETVWSIIEQAMKHSNAESATIDPNKSLYNFFEEAVEKLFVDEKDDVAKLKRQTILQMSEMWGAFVGSEIQKQSLKFFWMEECIDGENLFVAGTYKKVLEKIAQPAEEAGIRYKTTVKKLISNANDEGSDPSVTVEFEDAEGMRRETFDDVVMTAPLGWLKTNLNAFEPALPQRLQEGIAAIGYGHLDKVGPYRDLCSQAMADISRSTSPSQQRSGTSQLPPRAPTLPLRAVHRPHLRASLTSQQQPLPYINSARPTRQSTPRIMPASHPSSRLLTQTTQIHSIGIRKPSISPLCLDRLHIQHCYSTPTAPQASTLLISFPSTLMQTSSDAR